MSYPQIMQWKSEFKKYTDYGFYKLKENVELVKNIFEHSAFPILDINRKCQIITSNKSFKDLFVRIRIVV